MKGSIRRTVAIPLIYFATSATYVMADSGTITVNDTSGSTTSNSYTSHVVAIPAKTTNVTVAVHFSSVHGDTVPGYSLYRQVLWRIGYSFDNVNFSYTDYKTTQIGATTGNVSDSMTASLPWRATEPYLRVEYIAEDVPGGGTFTVPIQQYDTDSITISNPNSVEAHVEYMVPYYVSTNDPPTSGSETVTLMLQSYSPTTDWEVYEVDYQYDSSYYVAAAVLGDSATAGGPGGLYEYVSNGNASGDMNLNTFTTHSFTTSSYDPGKLKVTASGNAGGTTNYTQTSSARADVKITNGSAKIFIRKPRATTATANEFVFDSVNYETKELSWLSSVLMLLL